MDSNQIRRTFLDFFEARGHVVRPSAPLIPTDPTLLLTNAGMVPFKPYFLGEEEPPYLRAASVQKAVRTIDIDIIGSTVRHMSFFEMLGNFSFGDYFKPDAMAWSYELLTDGFGLDPELMWFTAYKDDDEAAGLWIDHVGVPAERVRRGDKDNFWQMGVPGPCGPCAEVFVDLRPELESDGGPVDGDEDRYVEVWNLVFMQNVQDRPYNVIGELPQKSIDTGMGLERLAMVVQQVPSVFDVDTVLPVRAAGERFTGVEHGDSPLTDVSLRILADHGRAMTVLIGDGVVPSNDGRGYVLRRLIRRAVRHAWQLGGEGLVTPKLVDATVEALGGWYEELPARRDFIVDVVEREEERFRRTLESGHQLLDVELEQLADEKTLPGRVAFKLHDTFGFPIELTEEIVAERGFAVDRESFDSEMDAQRSRARKEWKGGDEAARGEFYRKVMDQTGLTDFLGYELESTSGRILAIVRNGEMVESAAEGDEIEIFMDRTPFYAESGGQVGDTGHVSTETGRVVVIDTQHSVQGLHGHRAKVLSGSVRIGQDADLQIDSPRRAKIRKSHTGTHVLHWAIRDVVGDHARQAGSLVESGRLRFDFSHFSALSPQEISEVEAQANLRLIENHEVATTVTSKEEAREMGALAFFGDKYGDTVRVVKVGDFSVEFCGGTHTHTAGEVGPLVVLGEASIGSNLRRVEALTGEAAYRHLVGVRDALDHTSRLLRAPASEVPGRIEALLGKIETLEHEIEDLRSAERADMAADLAQTAVSVGDHKLLAATVGETAPDQLRQLALALRDRLGSSVVILGSNPAGKASLVCTIAANLVKAGLSAGELLVDPARLVGGGGARDPELAQAGGPKGEAVAAAIESARDEAGRALAGL